MDELIARAYVSWGLWVANCPRPDCLGAEHMGHAPVTGFVGGLTLAGFRCASCGLVCRSQFPANAEDIWFLLAQRPMVHTRTWLLGQLIEDLLAENIEHGIMPIGIEKPGDGITIIGGRFEDRALVAAGGPRLTIGG